jgi:hypothetical protein
MLCVVSKQRVVGYDAIYSFFLIIFLDLFGRQFQLLRFRGKRVDDELERMCKQAITA